jgi:hypothetical protein
LVQRRGRPWRSCIHQRSERGSSSTICCKLAQWAVGRGS